MPWEPGRSVVDHLIGRSRLDRTAPDGCAETAERLVERGSRRLVTARAGLQGGDVDGAFVAAYDAYRMAADALLYRQALRATAGEGSHVAVEDAVSAQFGAVIPEFNKPTFERFRRMRHAAQYFDPSSPELESGDGEWAIGLAEATIDGVRSLLGEGRLEPFTA